MDMREILSSPTLLTILWQLLSVLLAVLMSIWLSFIIEKRLRRSSTINANARVVLSKCLRILLVFVTVPMALSATGTDITAISVFSGALGVSVGWGLQRTVANYVGGLCILLDQSVRVGDVINVADHQGVVRDFHMRYVLLHKIDGSDVMLPNEVLMLNPVVNYSRDERKTNLNIEISVGPKSDLDQVMALILDVAKKQTGVLDHPTPRVFFTGVSELGFKLVLNYWIVNLEYGVRDLQTTLYLEIWRTFQLHGIEIPFLIGTNQADA